ncbi:hypothetical protein [Sorangium cellulosum]|uniref:hypothetical protein n=1 Tax=Sorangium cellulosum TaxID=56 RepID=UPI003B8487BC
MTALGFIHQLFAIDKATKDLAPSRRTEQRRSSAQPVLDAIPPREDNAAAPRSGPTLAPRMALRRRRWRPGRRRRGPWANVGPHFPPAPSARCSRHVSASSTPSPAAPR